MKHLPGNILALWNHVVKKADFGGAILGGCLRTPPTVTPAKAGDHNRLEILDPRSPYKPGTSFAGMTNGR
jgi:hypothetical protein